ncbi:MAG: dienelactone hydrolase family protein [Coriobacteriia bacterium]
MNATLDIPAGSVTLPGDLEVPRGARALVIFAHGSGSSRRSPRNMMVAERLRASGGIATLLFDLLTPGEDAVYANRFDIGLLAARLMDATAFMLSLDEFAGWPVGYFGASTGAASAIIAAERLPNDVQAVVSRGGRPDLAGDSLARLVAPTLLVVGGRDYEVLELNRSAFDRIPALHKKLEVVPGATHLFEEPGTLEHAAEAATGWFERYVVAAPVTTPRE